MILKQADIFLTRALDELAPVVGECQRAPGEGPTYATHAGIIVTDGDETSSLIIEATPQGIVKRPISIYSSPGHDIVWIYRHVGLSPDQRFQAVAAAQALVGTKYGWLRIAADFGDWLIGSKWFFRGMIPHDKELVCSSVDGIAYEAIDYSFLPGRPAEGIEPDDIWDWVQTHSEWVRVGVL
jgi:hypothetical protein